MNDYVFLKCLANEALPELPIPVRQERLHAVMHEGETHPDSLLDELDHFLITHPEYRQNYSELAGQLAYVTGLQMADIGLLEAAAHSLAIGARWCPESLSVRLNHAVALHLTGDYENALAEYLHALADPALMASPLATVLAARCCQALGKWQMGCALLESLAPLAPREPGFWEFLAEMKAKAAVSDEAQHPPQPVFCVNCGTHSVAGDRFCRQCGVALRVTSPSGDQ